MRKTLATALLGAALIAAAGPAAATTPTDEHTVAATTDVLSSEVVPHYLSLFDFVFGTIGAIVDHGSSNGNILPPCPYVPGGVDPTCNIH